MKYHNLVAGVFLFVLSGVVESRADTSIVRRQYISDGSRLELTKDSQVREVTDTKLPDSIRVTAPAGAQVFVVTGRYERVTHRLNYYPLGEKTGTVVWSNTYEVAPSMVLPEKMIPRNEPVIMDMSVCKQWAVTLFKEFADSRTCFVDAVVLNNENQPPTNLHMSIPIPRPEAGEFGIAQGRFISFAEDSLYLCTVPYTGKAVNQVTLWKVNLEKGAIEFLGHYDRYLTPVWKAATDMFPPPPLATNMIPSSVTPPGRPPKPA
jgi:hypothetical protein